MHDDDDDDDGDEAHAGKTFGEREDFPVLIFSRVPFRLVATDARSLSPVCGVYRTYRAVKAISIFDSCSAAVIHCVQTPHGCTVRTVRGKGSLPIREAFSPSVSRSVSPFLSPPGDAT